MYYKVLSQDLVSRGYKYKVQGEKNDLDKPFDTTSSCVPGGLYYTDKENLHEFLDYGSRLMRVTIPEYDSKGDKTLVVQDYKKWRSSCIILHELELDELPNIPGLIDWASKHGHLGIVKNLTSIGAEYTTLAMDLAASRGHLKIVKYLNGIGATFTTDAMDLAASGGHLEVLDFLGSLGATFTTDAMDWAAGGGHLEIVKFLELRKCNQKPTTTL